jgi:stage II sporulation SpoAA-like protein
MLERLRDLPPGIVGLKASGKVSQQDYEQTVEPLFEEIRHEGNSVRLLYQFAPEFEGFTAGGLWEDAKIGLRSMRLLDGCAVVTDQAWIRNAASVVSYLLPCPVRVFANRDVDDALAWLGTLPGPATAKSRLIPQTGVIVIEVTQALQTRDFDELALLADAYIQAHDKLEGLVVHAREFPGWENFDSLLRHVRFARDHHRRVHRVAVCSDSKLVKIAPRLAEHFIAAEIRPFGYDELDAAVAWAGAK